MTLLCFTNFTFATNDPELTEVYNKLKNYRTDSRIPPEVIIDTSVKVAAYNKVKNKIFINPEIIEFIESEYEEYEKEIYALIIGHELAHFYNGHGWVHGISNHKSITKENEINADRHAIYYSYLAGYDVSLIPNDFMDALYEWIPSESIEYPTLKERKLIFQKAEEEVQIAIQQFEAANLLLLMKEYELAIYAYENIAKEFPTKEILNNISVACIKQALQNFDPIDELKGMIYPIEFDYRITLQQIKTERTRAHTKNITKEEKILRSDLLIKAEKIINEIIKIDESYIMAYLNLATLFSLKAINEKEDSFYFLNAASSKVEDYRYRVRKMDKVVQREENIYSSDILDAIIFYHLGDNKKAIEYLINIDKLGLAKHNLFYIETGTIESNSITRQDCLGKRLSDFNLFEAADISEFETLMLDSDFFTIGKDNNNVIQVSQLVQPENNIELLLFEIKKNGETNKIWTIKTLNGFKGETCHGLTLGDNENELIEKAGDITFNQMNMSRGHLYYSYLYQGSFIYRIGMDNKINEIIYYSKK